MTIKEAFEKLTSVCAAGMKNPFFVMRKLHDAFADIADKIEGGGGGGSTVEVTQVVSTGTKIATITVDDTPTDLYAPNTEVTQVVSSGTKIATVAGTDLYAPANAEHVYSTTPRKVGTWTDGNDIYEVVVQLESPYQPKAIGTAFPAAVESILESADTIISVYGIGSGACVSIGIDTESNTIKGYTFSDWSLTDLILTYTVE